MPHSATGQQAAPAKISLVQAQRDAAHAQARHQLHLLRFGDAQRASMATAAARKDAFERGYRQGWHACVRYMLPLACVGGMLAGALLTAGAVYLGRAL